MEEDTRLERAIASADAHPNDFESLRYLLSTARKLKARENEVILRHGSTLLIRYSGKLDSLELWDVHEQVLISSLELHEFTKAKSLLETLKQQFPTSIRVRKLEGLYLEAQGKYAEADEIYTQILKADVANTYAMKRQIAIRKATGDLSETVRLLNEYLKIFMADVEAWQELGNVYIDLNMHKQAAFCYEELILAQPQNVHYCTKYAEIQYTIGGVEAVRVALKYFLLASQMSEYKYAAALTGAYMSALTLNSTKSGRKELESDGLDSSSLLSFTSQKITELYKEKAPAHLRVLAERVTQSHQEIGKSEH